jgi:polysaccharide deacetylase 2 family uncharacterized protein YibQ
MGINNLQQFLQINGHFFQNSPPVENSVISVIVILDFGYHISTAEERRDIPGKVNAAVLCQIQNISLLHDIVLGHIACLEEYGSS